VSQKRDWNAFNKGVIEQFRANGGQVPGREYPLILLTTTGAKSGLSRINPLNYSTDGDRIVVIASKGGADTNPDWYYNLLAQPLVTVEMGDEQFQARATVISAEPERSRLYAKMVEHRPGFAEYEQKTTRSIPAIVLERVA
jgi:deazaflavin-dependent oxidoreductase (nitroreductase family)